ncbi:MAG: carbon storage regulator [Dehalococcoidia bacterium]
MLILTRKAEQGIVIDRVTTVRILSIDGDRVKIGIDAPTSITVLREELLEQVAGQNREAAARPAASRSAVDRLRALRPEAPAPARPNGNGHNGGPANGATDRADEPSARPER